MTAYTKIRRAMLTNERYWLKKIQKEEKRGENWRMSPLFLHSLADYRALERLVEKGLLRDIPWNEKTRKTGGYRLTAAGRRYGKRK